VQPVGGDRRRCEKEFIALQWRSFARTLELLEITRGLSQVLAATSADELILRAGMTCHLAPTNDGIPHVLTVDAARTRRKVGGLGRASPPARQAAGIHEQNRLRR